MAGATPSHLEGEKKQIVTLVSALKDGELRYIDTSNK